MSSQSNKNKESKKYEWERSWFWGLTRRDKILCVVEMSLALALGVAVPIYVIWLLSVHLSLSDTQMTASLSVLGVILFKGMKYMEYIQTPYNKFRKKLYGKNTKMVIGNF